MANIAAQPIVEAFRNAEAGTQESETSEGIQHLTWLASASRAEDKDDFKYVLIFRFIITNMIGCTLLVLAFLHGFVERVMEADQTYISPLIFAVFFGGMCQCGLKLINVSRQLNFVRDFNPLVPSLAADYLANIRGRSAGSRNIIGGTIRLKLSQNLSYVRHTASSLLLLGLIGTVVGFIIALSGVSPESASDINAVGPMVSTLISGMSTALYTTLIGAILNVWLMINYQILAGGTVKLVTALQEFGESHARD